MYLSLYASFTICFKTSFSYYYTLNVPILILNIIADSRFNFKNIVIEIKLWTNKNKSSHIRASNEIKVKRRWNYTINFN